MNNSFEEIIEVIENSNKIAVAGHISPDGDAVASCCSMAMALIKKGKNAVVYLEEVPEKFKSVPIKCLRKNRRKILIYLFLLTAVTWKDWGNIRRLRKKQWY